MTHARRLGAPLVLLGLGCLFAAPALAAEAPGHLSSEATLLLQIVLLIFTGRLIGEIMTRLGQPSVMGQLLGGILLGLLCWGRSGPPCSTRSSRHRAIRRR
jgi:hypothetical protein